MIFIDTDIFVIDRIFPADKRFRTNRRFLERILKCEEESCTSIYNLFELLGIASYHLSKDELKSLLELFETAYKTRIVYPSASYESVNTFLTHFFEATYQKIQKKMNFQDAVILWIAEETGCETFFTWNKKDFAYRTELDVLTPGEFIESQSSVL